MSNSKTCTIEGCERPHRARGMCTTHRYRFDNGLPMEKEVRQYEHEPVCKVEGCENPRGGGSDGTHCAMHKRRVDRRGEAGPAERQRAPLNEAVWHQPENRRRYALLDNYGLTVEQYDALLLRQNYRCAICRTDRPENKRTKSTRSFCIDHDHETGVVRGLLCHACNRGIGLLKDDPAIVESAAGYLQRYRPDLGRPVSELVAEAVSVIREAPEAAIEIVRKHFPELLIDQGAPMPISMSPTIPPATTAPSGTIAEVTSTPAAPDVATNLTMTDTPEQAVSSAVGQRAGEAAKVHMTL